MRKQGSVPGEGFLVQQDEALAGMEEAAGALCLRLGSVQSVHFSFFSLVNCF